MPTIGDRLTDNGVSWAWFAEGWETAKLGFPPNGFSNHHQPFAYFAKYADGTSARADHLRSLHEFDLAVRGGLLPAVSFVQPLETHSEHPGNSILAGEQEIMRIINEVRDGPQWADAAIIITYDENGGFWDHVAPPVIDRWGPGTRVPTIVISPYAKRAFVDHTTYDTTSILALLEHRWGLAPLSARDAAANDMENAFDFSQTP
jgi:phospholipase C